MVPDDVQRALRFLSLVYTLSDAATPERIRSALAGPVELGDLPLELPWAIVEPVIGAHPAFLDKDPARRLWWELRDAEPLNRIHLTKALVDACDNQTLEAVDLLGAELRARPDLIQRMSAIVDDLSEVLMDDEFPPRQKHQMLSELLATV